tara:strand:+ start:261 stop:434 length:174 start_codon:yes stop_codon:yes gene_type:complete
MKGWKTILFNLIAGIILVLEQQGVSVWGLTTEVVSVATVVGNFVLRFLTTTPVGKSS